MVEVFKTNVNDNGHANLLIKEIHNRFVGYIANFDLEDCDRILRIRNHTGLVQSFLIIHLMKNMGFEAEILEDNNLSLVRSMTERNKYYPVLEQTTTN